MKRRKGVVVDFETISFGIIQSDRSSLTSIYSLFNLKTMDNKILRILSPSYTLRYNKYFQRSRVENIPSANKFKFCWKILNHYLNIYARCEKCRLVSRNISVRENISYVLSIRRVQGYTTSCALHDIKLSWLQHP